MEIELIEQATNEIAEYNPVEAGLVELRSRLENVSYDVTTTKGMAVAKADRAEVRALRTSLEAKRKEIKAPAIAHCKLIDEEAKRITAELLKLETPIDEQIKKEENRKYREKRKAEGREKPLTEEQKKAKAEYAREHYAKNREAKLEYMREYVKKKKTEEKK